MMLRRTVTAGLICAAIAMAGARGSGAQGAETFTATAAIKTAGGASATAPVTIVVTRTMSADEAKRFTSAFASGGVAALRKALEGVPPTGSITVGNGKPTATRLAMERTTDKGRLITLVTDQPILHLGAGLPDAKPTEGHDVAVLDLEVDGTGTGSGTLAPAAKVRVDAGAFVVEDYGGETIRLTGVKRAK